ncbi:hypothetical protein V6Z11_1Z058400 [Gossypium hirsutum]
MNKNKPSSSTNSPKTLKMELQSVCHSFHVPNFKFPNHRRFPFQSNLKPLSPTHTKNSKSQASTCIKM